MADVFGLKRRRCFSQLLLFFSLLDGSFTDIKYIKHSPHNLMMDGVEAGSRRVAHQRSTLGALCLDVFDENTRRVVASSSAVVDSSYGLQEVDALMEFRKGMVRDPHGVFLSWQFSAAFSVCSWTGVTCDNSTGGVTALDLSNQQLSGTLSPSLARLQFLTHLDLSSNSLEGIIPDNWGVLENLAILNLSFNGINGSIPSTISNCSSLRTLDFSGNQLTESIPEEIGLLLRINELHLDNNVLMGAIPSSLVNCSSLKFLNLSYNLLTGDLTSLDWNRLGGLEVLSLGINNISGRIPATLGRLQMLEHLYLYNNSLLGSIPTSLGNNSALTYLDFENNFLSGELPFELGRLHSLTNLDLQSNMLTGRIPSSLGNCSALGRLQLDFNRLTGEVPPQLGLLAHLTELSLHLNYLTGTIPRALGNCSSLEFLDLSFNFLSGDIPKELFRLLKLTTLYLYYNQLVGAIDPSIGNCTAVQVIAMATNSLTGSLPPELGLLKNLARLNFFQNSLTGIIPSEIGNCSSMWDFSVRGNKLTGTIPASLGQLVQLQALRLGENFLTGFIPPELFKCKDMTILWLFSNRLTGPIPDEFDQLQHLSTLNVSDNLLTGSIPSSLSNCVSLLFLNLASNRLTGPIPSVVLASLVNLQIEFNLSRNQLSGQIPVEIGQLSRVQTIDLSFNNLSGEIPTTLGACQGLLSLNLSFNILQGGIPESLATLATLNELNVSFNRLTGAIPAFAELLNFTSASFIGNTDLCGNILDRSCSSRSCHGIRCYHTAIILSPVLGFAVIVVVVACSFGWATRIRPRAVPTVLIDNRTGEFSLTAGDILAATDGFSEANIVGVGAKSTIYKGVLPWGMKIAVKKMQSSIADESTTLELRCEVQSLGDLRHRNLLRVYDFCSTARMNALVLEYMPSGSLWNQLHETVNCLLNLDQRLAIAIGVAEALVYLHHECPRPIIHLDLKPSNILLDEELIPKVADFGISKFVRDDSQGEASASRFLHGTIGYIPPEYAACTNVSTKGDVYSFGVVLLELITRKQPTDGMFSQGLTFRQWIMDASPQKLADIVDKSLVDELVVQEDRLRMILQVGLWCTVDAPSKRPTMKDARNLLLHIKTLNNLYGSSS